MAPIQPGSPAELAETLADANRQGRTVRVGGNFTKDKMAGPLMDADVTVSTRRMDRVLIYEPADLTVSVEAGIGYAELSRVLAEHRRNEREPERLVDRRLGLARDDLSALEPVRE